jgi:O-antigen/teichoic acid export membrane protein
MAASTGSTLAAAPRRTTMSSAWWLLGEKGLRVVSAVFVATAVARHLGPAEYGALAVAIAWMAVPQSAAGMGADHVNQSLLADDAGQLHSLFVFRLAWALGCALLAWLVAWHLALSPLAAYTVLALGVGLVSATIFVHALYAQGRFRLVSILGLCALALGVGLRLLGLQLGWGVTEFAACVMIELALPGLLAAVVLLHQRASRSGSPLNLDAAKRYARLCWPMALSALLVTLFFRLDLFIVNGQLGPAAAGTWAAAMMFVMPWTLVSGAVLPVAARRLREEASSPETTAAHFVALLQRMLGLAAVAVLCNWAAMAWLVPHLLGPQYAKATQLGFVTSLLIAPLFAGAVQELWLAQRRQTGLVLRKVLVGLPLAAALSVWAVSQHGLWGAAAAAVLAQCLTAFALNAWLDRDFFRLQLQALGLRHEH